MPDCRIQVENAQNDLSLDAAAWAPLVLAVLSAEQVEADEVVLHFVSLDTSSSMHSKHFGDSSPTDTMSFPLDGSDEPCRHLGEVVVCPKVAIDYVAEHGGDSHEETALYVVHGVLHLLGYRDDTPETTRTMREAEARYRSAIQSCAMQLKRGL